MPLAVHYSIIAVCLLTGALLCLRACRSMATASATGRRLTGTLGVALLGGGLVYFNFTYVRGPLAAVTWERHAVEGAGISAEFPGSPGSQRSHTGEGKSQAISKGLDWGAHGNDIILSLYYYASTDEGSTPPRKEQMERWMKSITAGRTLPEGFTPDFSGPGDTMTVELRHKGKPEVERRRLRWYGRQLVVQSATFKPSDENEEKAERFFASLRIAGDAEVRD